MPPYSASAERIAAPNLAVRLTDRMKKREISVRRLADDAAVNKDTIRRWRTGKVKSVRLELADRVAGALGMTTEDLLDLPSASATGTATTTVEIGPLVSRLETLLAELDDAVSEARRVRSGA